MNLTEINQFLPWATVLVIFFGMTCLVWRALSIAHDLAKLALQAKPQDGVAPTPTAPIPPVARPSPPVEPAPTKQEILAAVDQGLVDFIKKEEGFAPIAKWDYKQWTNGYGTKALHSNETISEKEAEIRLREEIAIANALVTKRFPNLPKGQEQALTDLTFNAGSGWEDQSLGRAVAAQKIDTIKADIAQYVHAGKPPVVLEDLVQRRAKEIAMIDNPL